MEQDKPEKPEPQVSNNDSASAPLATQIYSNVKDDSFNKSWQAAQGPLDLAFKGQNQAQAMLNDFELKPAKAEANGKTREASSKDQSSGQSRSKETDAQTRLAVEQLLAALADSAVPKKELSSLSDSLGGSKGAIKIDWRNDKEKQSKEDHDITVTNDNKVLLTIDLNSKGEVQRLIYPSGTRCERGKAQEKGSSQWNFYSPDGERMGSWTGDIKAVKNGPDDLRLLQTSLNGTEVVLSPKDGGLLTYTSGPDGQRLLTQIEQPASKNNPGSVETRRYEGKTFQGAHIAYDNGISKEIGPGGGIREISLQLQNDGKITGAVKMDGAGNINITGLDGKSIGTFKINQPGHWTTFLSGASSKHDATAPAKSDGATAAKSDEAITATPAASAATAKGELPHKENTSATSAEVQDPSAKSAKEQQAPPENNDHKQEIRDYFPIALPVIIQANLKTESQKENPDRSVIKQDRLARPTELCSPKPESQTLLKYHYSGNSKTPDKVELADGTVFEKNAKHGWVTYHKGDKYSATVEGMQIKVNQDGTCKINYDRIQDGSLQLPAKSITVKTNGNWEWTNHKGDNITQKPDGSAEYIDKKGLLHIHRKGAAEDSEEIGARSASGEFFKLTKFGQWELPSGKKVSGELENKDGHISIKQTTGLRQNEEARIYKENGVEELRKKDGSTVESKDGKVSRVIDSKGWIREFSYKNDELTGYTLKRPDGEEYKTYTKIAAGQWECKQTHKIMRSSSDKVTPDGTYSWRDSSAEHLIGTDGIMRERKPDGSTEYIDGKGFTHVHRPEWQEGREEIQYREKPGEKVWKCAGGDPLNTALWIMPNGKSKEGKLIIAQDGPCTLEIKPQNASELKHYFKNGGIEEIVKKDGSTLELANGHVRKITYKDGWSREFEFKDKEGKELTGYTLKKPDGSAYSHWQKTAPETWKNDSGKVITSKGDALDKEGNYSWTDGTGIKVTHSTDGTVKHQYPILTGADVQRVWNKVYERLDHDSAGRVDKKSLAKAMQNPEFKGEEAMVIAALYNNFDAIKSLSNDEWGRESAIDPNDIKSFAVLQSKSREQMTPDERALADKVNSNLLFSRCELDKCSERGLYADKEDPLKSINPDAVLQPPDIGDCYFEAAMIALAKVNPQAIKDMIKDNNDGTYTVTFPGIDPITVKETSDGEIANYGGSGKHGTWPSVLRKAYGQYCAEHFWRRNLGNIGGGHTNIEATDGGSFRDAGLRILTGKGIDDDLTSFTRYSTIDKKLKDSLHPDDPAKRQAVTAFIKGGSGKTEDGFTKGHQYAILDYEPNSENLEKGYITVRDPHGETRKITLKMFNDNFTSLQYLN